MSSSRVEHVTSFLKSEQSAEVYAAQHGLDPHELREWRDLFLAGATASRPSRRPRAAWLAALGVVAVLVPAAVSANTACNTSLPGALIPFCPDTPAMASEVNANFRELARFIEGRTGSMDAGVSTQDIFQRETAVWYARDNSFNFNANSIELGNGSGNGVVAAIGSGNSLVLNNGNSYNGGTTIDSALRVSNGASVNSLEVRGGSITGSNLNVSNYLVASGGFSVTNARPYFDSGLAHRNCYDRYGGFNGSNQFSFGECDSGHYMVGLQCRDNGVNSIQCMAKCCAP